MALSKIQREILEGSMLGDGHLSIGARAVNPRFRINRCVADYAYAAWTRDNFSEYCTERSLKRSRSYNRKREITYERLSLVTRRHPDFFMSYKRWYPNGHKILPETIILSPITVAVWLADDGCIYQKKKRGSKAGLELSFATAGFGKTGTERLAAALENKYGLGFNVYGGYATASHYKIVTSTRPARHVFEDIDSIFPPLERKSLIWRERMDIERIQPNCLMCKEDAVFKNGCYTCGPIRLQRLKCRACGYTWKV